MLNLHTWFNTLTSVTGSYAMRPNYNEIRFNNMINETYSSDLTSTKFNLLWNKGGMLIDWQSKLYKEDAYSGVRIWNLRTLAKLKPNIDINFFIGNIILYLDCSTFWIYKRVSKSIYQTLKHVYFPSSAIMYVHDWGVVQGYNASIKYKNKFKKVIPPTDNYTKAGKLVTPFACMLNVAYVENYLNFYPNLFKKLDTLIIEIESSPQREIERINELLKAKKCFNIKSLIIIGQLNFNALSANVFGDAFRNLITLHIYNINITPDMIASLFEKSNITDLGLSRVRLQSNIDTDFAILHGGYGSTILSTEIDGHFIECNSADVIIDNFNLKKLTKIKTLKLDFASLSTHVVIHEIFMKLCVNVTLIRFIDLPMFYQWPTINSRKPITFVFISTKPMMWTIYDTILDLLRSVVCKPTNKSLWFKQDITIDNVIFASNFTLSNEFIRVVLHLLRLNNAIQQSLVLPPITLSLATNILTITNYASKRIRKLNTGNKVILYVRDKWNSVEYEDFLRLLVSLNDVCIFDIPFKKIIVQLTLEINTFEAFLTLKKLTKFYDDYINVYPWIRIQDAPLNKSCFVAFE